jgi:hypothetical protein
MQSQKLLFGIDYFLQRAYHKKLTGFRQDVPGWKEIIRPYLFYQ